MPQLKALDIITDALTEIGSYSVGETPSADDASTSLRNLNRMLDAWAAQRLFAYALNFNAYTLQPGLSPHTIGPNGATFTVAQRPVKLENANIILNDTTPPVKFPMGIRDADWWSNQRIPTLATTLPTDVYYEPDWPNGKLFIWPVPQIAYQIELETWVLISQIPAVATPFSLPPGYQDAITYSLAERLSPVFGKELSPGLVSLAARARSVIQNLNSASPLMQSSDSGVPKGGRNRSGWNVYTGTVT